MLRLNSLLPAVGAAALLLAPAIPVRAETRIEKDLKLEPGGKLILDSDAGSVKISGSSRPGAHLVITSQRDDLKDRFDFSFQEAPGTVTVTARKKGSLKGWFSRSGDGAPQFEIEVPTQTGLQIKTGGGHLEVASIHGDSNLETSGGHISVSDLAGKLAARTSGGHIELRAVDGSAWVNTSGGHIEVTSLKGSLEAETSGGHIELHEVSGDIKAETSGGHIRIDGAGGRVDGETSGGSVKVAFAAGNQRGGRLETSGGSVAVRLDKSAELAIDADASGGTVQCSLPVTIQGTASKSSIRGSLGKGGEPLVIRASGGSIQIDPL